MPDGGNARFDLPWRIDWSVPEGKAAEEGAAFVREASPMLVVLTAPDAGRLLPLALPWPGTEAVWVFTGWREGFPPSRPPVARVELPVEGLAGAREACAALPGDWAPGNPALALRWSPRPETLSGLPGLLALARERRWGVTLPAAPAEEATSIGPWPMEALSPDDWAAARGEAAALGTELAVHDFHFSRALGLAGPEPAGCEAGDALAFVDSDGSVYPCRSLRLRLGALSEGLEALWASPARARLRLDLASPGEACRGCGHLSRCRGGCRGLAFHARGRFDAPDPRCPEKAP